MEGLAKASHMSIFQHILASIPYFNGTGNVDVINWLERIEAACLYARRDPRTKTLGHCSGKVLDSILSVPSNQPWTVLKTRLIRTYSKFKSAAHSCSYLDSMHWEDDEDLRIYIWHYTQAHKMVTGLNPNENVDPFRWTCFLASINNTPITDKVLHGKTLPHTLEDAMKRLLAGGRLSTVGRC